MRFVLDTSIAIKWVIQEADSLDARKLRDAYQQSAHELIAPDIFQGEVAHTLTKLERKGTIPIGTASPLLANIITTTPILYRYLPLLGRACQISSQTRQGFFDCLYVALAERERCVLVTADQKLIKNLKSAYPFVTDLASLP
jgi:predicted nucleic acid-binding protein